MPLTNSSFGFQVISLWRLAGALVAVLVVVIISTGVGTRAHPNHPEGGTCCRRFRHRCKHIVSAVGKWRLWFTLIFCAFVYLFLILWDADTITTQALYLMGISSSTALAAVAIDVAKDSPADAVNRGLQALGLKTR